MAGARKPTIVERNDNCCLHVSSVGLLFDEGFQLCEWDPDGSSAAWRFCF
jgi:hypothetical protein